MVLDKDAIKEADDLGVETVDVPEWNGTVGVKRLTGAERDEFDQYMYDRRDPDQPDQIPDIRGVRIELVMRTACDESGNLLFDEEDRSWLRSKSAAALDRIVKVAQRVNGLSEEDVRELSGN